MTQPILPTADAILTPAIDAIVADIPAALAHFNTGGRWADLPALWRAQLLLNLARLGDEVQSARLRFATGDSLRALCASEFNTTLPPAPQTAFATVTLTRPPPAPAWQASTNYGRGAIVQPSPTNGFAYQASVAGQSGVMQPSFSTTLGATTSDGSITWVTIAVPVAPAGAVRTSDLFRKTANPSGVPLPIGAATYAPVRAVPVAAGQLSVTVPLLAQAAGVAANIPAWTNYPSQPLIAPAQPLAFDSTWAASSSTAGGGSSGLTDPVLVAAARAYAVGQFGPTTGALIAGALQQQSVRHYAFFPASTDVAYAQGYIADQSWSSDPGWVGSVAQAIADSFQGFGCRTRWGTVVNQHVALTATIVLRSTDDLNQTDPVDVNVRAAAESYFNDRPDWYRFRLGTLRALLSRCDPRIQECRQLALTDAVTGATVPEPANTFGVEWADTVTHFYLVDQNVTTTYLPPA